jgi:hypothetical protein
MDTITTGRIVPQMLPRHKGKKSLGVRQFGYRWRIALALRCDGLLA